MKDTKKITISWPSTLTDDFPVFFYGVEGRDAQEGDSPSFFNPEEALALVNFIQTMLYEIKVDEKNICVISAYVLLLCFVIVYILGTNAISGTLNK